MLPVIYEGLQIDAGYRIDILIEGQVIVEVKSVEALSRLHHAQLLTYLKLSGCRTGLLMNFNVVLFKDGLKTPSPLISSSSVFSVVPVTLPPAPSQT